MVYSASRGYYLNISSTIQDSLPAEFIQCVLNKKTISCTTEDLASLSDRASESISTALFHTHELIQDILQQIRVYMNSLFIVVDAVALLDMLCSHTKFCYSCFQQGFPLSRPIITTDSTSSLVIKEGRHIVVESLQNLDNQFVPNDTCVTTENTMQIVTGPNGSGKSTLIKQVAIIVVLAQIGCFVPALSAIIPIRHRILSRIGTSDDPEHNLSSFLVEMREAAYILDHVNNKSLVIIDELGRGTSTIDGCSIAFAVAEELLRSECFCLFVTHFPEITALQELYFPKVRNKHLQITLQDVDFGNTTTRNDRNNGINRVSENRDNGSSFLYQVGEGSSVIRGGYGLRMAELCGFPQEILRLAWNMQTKARQVLPRFILPSVDRTNDVTRVLLRRLCFLSTSSLNQAGITAYVDNIRKKISKSLMQSITMFCSHELALLERSNPNTSIINSNTTSNIGDIDTAISVIPSTTTSTLGTEKDVEVDDSIHMKRMLSTTSIMTTEQVRINGNSNGYENTTSSNIINASGSIGTNVVVTSRKVMRTQSMTLSEVQSASPFKKKAIEGLNSTTTTTTTTTTTNNNNGNTNSSHKAEHDDDDHEENKKPSVIYINSSSTSIAFDNIKANMIDTNTTINGDDARDDGNDGVKSVASFSLSSLSTHNTAATLSQTESQLESQPEDV